MTSQAIYRCSRSGKLLLLQAAAGRTDGSVKRIRLLVDTGSSYTIVWSEIAKEIGCDLQNPLRRLTTLTGGGAITAPVVAVPWFSCLGHPVENFPILTPICREPLLQMVCWEWNFSPVFRPSFILEKARFAVLNLPKVEKLPFSNKPAFCHLVTA